MVLARTPWLSALSRNGPQLRSQEAMREARRPPPSLALRALALSARVLPDGADALEVALDVLAWVVVALLGVALFKLHQVCDRRRRGYREIRQDDHTLYSQALLRAKDSWESGPLADRSV